MTKKIANIIERKIEKLSGGNEQYEALLREVFFADNEIGSAVIEAETKENSEITELKRKIQWLEDEKETLKRDLETQTKELQKEVDDLYVERGLWSKKQEEYKKLTKLQEE